jgi:hypothetical protein
LAADVQTATYRGFTEQAWSQGEKFHEFLDLDELTSYYFNDNSALRAYSTPSADGSGSTWIRDVGAGFVELELTAQDLKVAECSQFDPVEPDQPANDQPDLSKFTIPDESQLMITHYTWDPVKQTLTDLMYSDTQTRSVLMNMERYLRVNKNGDFVESDYRVDRTTSEEVSYYVYRQQTCQVSQIKDSSSLPTIEDENMATQDSIRKAEYIGLMAPEWTEEKLHHFVDADKVVTFYFNEQGEYRAYSTTAVDGSGQIWVRDLGKGYIEIWSDEEALKVSECEQ